MSDTLLKEDRVTSDAAERAVRDRSFAHSVAWTGAVKWTGQILTWISTLVVVRFLSPDDYGLVGLATVYLGLVTLLSEFGLGITVITLRDLTKEEVAELNTVALLLGVLGFGISCLVAIPLGSFFRAPELPPVVIALSTCFVISAFRTIPSALLQRDLQFKTEALLEGLQGLATAGTMVWLAWAGFGYWTLVVGSIFGTVLITAATLCVRRHPFRWPRADSAARALTFTRHQVIGNFAWYTYSNADFLIAGRVLGQAALGVYTVAWTLALTFPEKITGLIMRVTPAYFSAVQNEHAELRRYLLKLTEMLSLMSFPALIGIALVANDLVAIALGDKWLGVVTPLRLLAIYAAYDSVSQLLARVLTAIGEVRFLMRVGIALALVMPFAFYIASSWGAAGIAAAWLLIHPFSQVAVFWRVRKKIDVPLRQYLHALRPAVEATAAMVAAVLLIQQALPTTLAAASFLAWKVLTGAVTYVGVLVFRHAAALSAMSSWLRTAMQGA